MKGATLVLISLGILLFFSSFALVSAATELRYVGDTSTTAATNSLGTQAAVAYKFTANYTGWIEIIQVYWNEAGTVQSRSASLYSSNGSSPLSRISSWAGTQAITGLSTTNNWTLLDGSARIINGTEYFIVFNLTSYTSGATRFGETTGTPRVYFANASTFNETATWATASGDVASMNVRFWSNPNSDPYVTLRTPADNANLNGTNVLFNASALPINGNITNMTIYLWNSSGQTINQTTSSIAETSTNSTSWTINNIALGQYQWNVRACALNLTSTICSFAGSNFTFTVGAIVNNTVYNSSTYETSLERFTSNITIPSGSTLSSATLYYNGTSYSATTNSLGSNVYQVTRSIDVPASAGTKNWFWSFIFSNGFQQNTTSTSQTVTAINLTICGGSPQNVPYINFTFKDESTNTAMGASIDTSSWTYYLGTGAVNKTYSYSNSNSLNSFAFCFSPASSAVNVDLSLRYSNTSYPQRAYSFDSTSLTNTTTNQVLYLLSTDDGIYSSFQTVTSASSPISSVLVTIERDIGGTFVVLGQQLSGSDGLVTFWVNPNYVHRITATKTGYTTSQVSITPSQSLYSIIMDAGTSGATFNGSLEGMKWLIFPSGGLVGNQNNVFGINLSASLNNLDGSFCKMELVRSDTDAVLTSTTGGSSGGCNLSITYNIPSDIRIFGKFYVDTTDSSGFILIDGDARWFEIETNVSSWRTVKSFFEELKNLPEFGENIRQEYSRVVFFFVILAIILGVFSYFTGYESLYPGAFIIFVFFIVLLASQAGYFTADLGPNMYTWVEKYWAAILSFFLTAGYLLNYWSKS